MLHRMMVGGKKTRFYSDNLIVKIDPNLRAQLAAAAERERLSMSELVRRGVRAALTQSERTGEPRAC